MAAGVWRILASEVVVDAGVFRLRKDTCAHPVTGKVHPFFVVETEDWVNVLPITDDGKAVLIEQWRHGIAGSCTEIPGGMLEPGETPADGAARELLEETGYGFDELVSLGSVATNPAINTNRCHLFVARGARPIADATPEDTEDIHVMLVPLAEAMAMVDDGRMDHTMVVNTFLRLRLDHGPGATRVLESISRRR